MANSSRNEKRLSARPSEWRALLPFAGIFLLWQVASSCAWVNPYLLPSPAKVMNVLSTMLVTGEIWRHVFSSLLRVAFGFLIALILAVVLAVGCVSGCRFAFLYDVPLRVIRMIPPLSLVPMLILWFGLGELPKLILIVLSAFFPIYINTKDGMERGGEKYADIVRVFGFAPKKTMLSVVLPSAIPDLLSGVRIGFGYSWRALIGAEMLAATSGLGYYILDAQAMARTDKVLAGIVVIVVIGAISDAVLKKMIAKIVPENMKYE